MIGHVREEDGYSLGAEVTLLKSGLVIQSLKSDSETGAFRFCYLVEGNYEISAADSLSRRKIIGQGEFEKAITMLNSY